MNRDNTNTNDVEQKATDAPQIELDVIEILHKFSPKGEDLNGDLIEELTSLIAKEKEDALIEFIQHLEKECIVGDDIAEALYGAVIDLKQNKDMETVFNKTVENWNKDNPKRKLVKER